MSKHIYKVLLYGGYVGLIGAESLEEARAIALSEEGSANVQSVTLANDEDIAWVKALGGPVPGSFEKLPSEWAKEGYYVIEGKFPKTGASIDYYDRDGRKHSGTVKAYVDNKIVIDGERTVIVTETFTIRYGR